MENLFVCVIVQLRGMGNWNWHTSKINGNVMFSDIQWMTMNEQQALRHNNASFLCYMTSKFTLENGRMTQALYIRNLGLKKESCVIGMDWACVILK